MPENVGFLNWNTISLENAGAGEINTRQAIIYE
jgi:hypothetical protein